MLASTIATTYYQTGGEPFRIVVDPPAPITGVDGRPAVVPQVTGMAYRTGEHVFSIDLHEQLVPGFLPR